MSIPFNIKLIGSHDVFLGPTKIDLTRLRVFHESLAFPVAIYRDGDTVELFSMDGRGRDHESGDYVLSMMEKTDERFRIIILGGGYNEMHEFFALSGAVNRFTNLSSSAKVHAHIQKVSMRNGKVVAVEIVTDEEFNQAVEDLPF